MREILCHPSLAKLLISSIVFFQSFITISDVPKRLKRPDSVKVNPQLGFSGLVPSLILGPSQLTS
jgi:hypothetical protein